MTKHVRTVEIPATTHEVVDKIECDLCGGSAQDPDGTEPNIDHVTIRRETGYRSSDGGSYTATIVDVCAQCFETKVMPFLQREGAKPRKEEVDW